jgi:stage V sporulation protein B
MEKAFEMGKTSATGSVQLLVGVATSTIIMALGAIILGNLLTQDQYGLYAIALAPSTLINLFRDWGINSAMAKQIASLRVSHRDEEIRDVIAAGVIFEVLSGLALSVLSLLLASVIASFYSKPESASYIAIFSVTIISGSLLTASQAGFVGYERMELNSLTLISQAIVKTAIGPILVLLGYSVLGAVIGSALGSVAAAIIGLAIFYAILIRPLERKRIRNFHITKTLKTLLTYGLPLSISSIVGGILGQIYAFMIIPLTSTTIYGNYAVAANFTVLLTFFTIPIGTVIFPAFAKIDPENEPELLKNVYASSIKYTSILVVPATMVLMILSGPMIGTLYGAKYVYGPFFQTLMVVSNLFILVGSLSAGGLLTGLGKTRIPMYQSIATIIVGIPLGFFLIPTLGMTGLILAGLLSGIPSMIWGLFWIWTHYRAKADFKSSTRIFAASGIAAITTYVILNFIPLAEWIRLTVGLMIFFGIYIFTAPMIGAITPSEIDNLRTMLSGLGLVSKAIDLPLILTEKVSNLRTKIARALAL